MNKQSKQFISEIGKDKEKHVITEVESALVSHPKVAEAAVVGFPHDIKGQGIYAFVTLMTGIDSSEIILKSIISLSRSVLCLTLAVSTL